MVAVIGGAIHFNSRWTVQGHFASQWTVNAHNFPRSLPLTKFDDRWTHRKGSCISITPLPGTTPHPLPPPPPPPTMISSIYSLRNAYKKGNSRLLFCFSRKILSKVGRLCYIHYRRSISPPLQASEKHSTDKEFFNCLHIPVDSQCFSHLLY